MKEMEHQDLLIAVWTDPTPGFYSAVGWDEFGRSTPPVQLRMPFDDPRFIDCVDRLEELGPEELQYVGARLFDSLFQGDCCGSTFIFENKPNPPKRAFVSV